MNNYEQTLSYCPIELEDLLYGGDHIFKEEIDISRDNSFGSTASTSTAVSLENNTEINSDWIEDHVIQEPRMSKRKYLKLEDELEVNLTQSQDSKKQRTKRFWKEREYILLAGITMTYFAGRHSMKEGKNEACYAEKGVTRAWSHIHTAYETARLRLNYLYSDDLPARSANALRKKWKDSGKKSDGFHLFLNQESDTPNTIMRLVQFIQVYNKNFVLTCSETKFEKLRNELKTKY